MAKGDIPKIVWGDSFQHTLDIGYPLFDAVSYSEPAPGSEWARTPGGTWDAWITGTDQILEGEIRYVAPADATNPVASGWDAADGWGAFFVWARAGNAFRWYDDKDVGTYVESYLLEPMSGAPRPAEDDTRSFYIKFRSVSGAAYTGY